MVLKIFADANNSCDTGIQVPGELISPGTNAESIKILELTAPAERMISGVYTFWTPSLRKIAMPVVLLLIKQDANTTLIRIFRIYISAPVHRI